MFEDGSNNGSSEYLEKKGDLPRDLSPYGINPDSTIAQVLSESQTRNEAHEIVANLSGEIEKVFGTTSYMDIREEVGKALQYDTYAKHIKTPEDFRKYAEKMVEVAKSFMVFDDSGKATGGLYAANHHTAEMAAQMAYLIHSDPPDRDLDLLLEIAKKDTQSRASYYHSTFDVLYRINTLIKTSGDLYSAKELIQTLQDNGYKPKEYLSLMFRNASAGLGVDHQNPNIEIWEKVDIPFSEVVYVLEKAVTAEGNLSEFIHEINTLHPKERAEYIRKAGALAKKGVSPQFILSNKDALDQIDEKKEGLAIFTSDEMKKKWIENCVTRWERNPSTIDAIAPWLEKALTATKSRDGIRVTKENYKTKIEHAGSFSRAEREEIEQLLYEKRDHEVIPDKSIQEFTRDLIQSRRYFLHSNPEELIAVQNDEKRIESITKIQEQFPETHKRLVALQYLNLFLESQITTKEITDVSEKMNMEPPEESIQKAYETILDKYKYPDKYLEYYHPDEVDLINPRKIAIAQLKSIYEATNVVLSGDLLQTLVLEDKDIYLQLPFPISFTTLNHHFSQGENRDLKEFKRVYHIFAPYEYYQKVLAKLDKEESLSAKEQSIEIRESMAEREMDNPERYTQLKERIHTFSLENNTVLNKKVAEAFASLVKNGDTNLSNQLVDIIRKRSKSSNTPEQSSGITKEQEIALRALMTIYTPAANEALFSLCLAKDIDQRMKKVIMRNLLEDKKDFFPRNMRNRIKDSMYSNAEPIRWEDLTYFSATLQISNADIRRKSVRQVDRSFAMFPPDVSIADIHKKQCPAVPENIFMQLYRFTNGSETMLAKFNNLYQKTKGSTMQEELLTGIVNEQTVDDNLHKKVLDKLQMLDINSAPEMANLLKTIYFLSMVDIQMTQEESNVSKMLESPVQTVGELNDLLKKLVVEKVKEVLPNEKIDIVMIQELMTRWGSLEPLFIYAGKLKGADHEGTLQLIADMVPYIADTEEWKAWRYNMEEQTVKDQIGLLSAKQREVWKQDQITELGNIIISATPTDQPKQIVRQLQVSLGERHIYNPEIDKSSKYQYVQRELAKTYDMLAQQPEKKEMILTDEIRKLQNDVTTIDAITRYESLPRIEQVLKIASEEDMPLNKRTIDSLNFISQFLSKKQNQSLQMMINTATAGNIGSVKSMTVLTAELVQALEAKKEEITNDYTKAMQADIFERYQLNIEDKNKGQFYQKRQEVKVLIDLYKISMLTPQLIANDKIDDRGDKKGEALSQVIKNARKYFKDNPTFLQDLDNIEGTIMQTEEVGAKRRLAMVMTDDPQMMFQIGKYPDGCKSCQNYEGDVEWNKALAAYIADAHIKAMYLIDLNKLPIGVREQMREQGFNAVKNEIPPQDLLEASIARSIVKIVETNESKPAVFLEPTYTQINKGDKSMDKYFNIFAELMVSGPMDISLVRGGGTSAVTVPKSRNPEGQYEDCEAGNMGAVGMGIQTGSYMMFAKHISKHESKTKKTNTQKK